MKKLNENDVKKLNDFLIVYNPLVGYYSLSEDLDLENTTTKEAKKYLDSKHNQFDIDDFDVNAVANFLINKLNIDSTYFGIAICEYIEILYKFFDFENIDKINFQNLHLIVDEIYNIVEKNNFSTNIVKFSNDFFNKINLPTK